MNAKALAIGMQACGGRSLTFGQIGVDNLACPENCTYCAFAACNAKTAGTAMSGSELSAQLQALAAKNVDAVSLMGTAALPFEEYLHMVELARENLPQNIGVIVNYRDMTANEVSALKQAGATCVYHTVRIREGEITGIDPDLRRKTIEHVQNSGMHLMNGVEPVWEPFDEALAEDVADRIVEAVAQKPHITGVCGLCAVKNSTFAGTPPSTERVQLVASVLRLAAGNTIPHGCIGNIHWVDAGFNPRERD